MCVQLCRLRTYTVKKSMVHSNEKSPPPLFSSATQMSRERHLMKKSALMLALHSQREKKRKREKMIALNKQVPVNVKLDH